MDNSFIKLNCANCGAKLDVYEDTDRFACGSCGTELTVRRRGGTIALKAVTEAIHKVQAGTDRAAAELAIARFEKEREKLNKQQGKGAAGGCLGGCLGTLGFIVILAGAVLIYSGDAGNVFFGILLILGCISGLYLMVKQSSTREDQIRQLDQRIAEQKRVADASGG
jgi:ribosomal protein S27AE